jgi:hypothetical protein
VGIDKQPDQGPAIGEVRGLNRNPIICQSQHVDPAIRQHGGMDGRGTEMD